MQVRVENVHWELGYARSALAGMYVAGLDDGTAAVKAEAAKERVR